MRAVLGDAETRALTALLLDQKTLAGVRFSVDKIFWLGTEFHDDLDDDIYGTITRWADSKNLKVSVEWDDEERETFTLHELLPAPFRMRTAEVRLQ